MQLENCDGPVTGTQLNLSIVPATAVIGSGTDVRQRAGESRGAGTPSGHRTRGAAGGNRPYLVPAIRDCSLAAFIRGAAGGNRPYSVPAMGARRPVGTGPTGNVQNCSSIQRAICSLAAFISATFSSSGFSCSSSRP